MGKKRNEWWAGLFLFGLTLWTMRVLLTPGFYGSHDGTYLYARVVQMVHELKAGQFPVRVSTQMAYSRGYPIFNYNYPLFFYLAATGVLMGLGVATSIKGLIILATFWSVWAGYKWLRCFFDFKASLTGAVLFLLAPYRFLITFVIGSFGTVLALAVVTSLLWAISEVVVKKNERYLIVFALFLAGLPLAHNVTALIFAPLIGFYILMLLKIYDGWEQLPDSFYAGLLGLGLSAFFWLPAILEMSLVRLGTTPAAGYFEHFSTLRQLTYDHWGYGYSNPGTQNDGMAFMLGISQWVVIGMTALLLAVPTRKNREHRQIATLLLVTVFFTMYLMLENSEWIWERVRVMRQIQFPWRLLAVEIVIVSFLAAYSVSRFNHWLVVIILVVLSLVANRHFMRPMVPYLEPEGKYADDQILINGTTDIAWELMPIQVKKVPLPWPDGEKRRFYMPQWLVLIDGVETKTYPDEDGYLAYEAREGQEVIIRLKSTPIERKANMISVLSLFGLLLYWVKVETAKAPKN